MDDPAHHEAATGDGLEGGMLGDVLCGILDGLGALTCIPGC
ncbi:hypothetical protein [Brachybacterium sp. Z12]|nr:hypothetical protein [Brachybacterium sp. Z12]